VHSSSTSQWDDCVEPVPLHPWPPGVAEAGERGWRMDLGPARGILLAAALGLLLWALVLRFLGFFG